MGSSTTAKYMTQGGRPQKVKKLHQNADQETSDQIRADQDRTRQDRTGQDRTGQKNTMRESK